ncbi:type II toxin-antitoxin system HipA family toxin YjjJ [Propionivibrio sp.]|uniref:type II toxin-antitoxin system HipA family toxin YjjJ n=1 Tax=Propionivibrio sp. TaxID=2212460 RepID=UPI002615E2B3|nr:type II toxin-antitoxin system HipA family toxin YjjJ [Propionivibrio sp.]
MTKVLPETLLRALREHPRTGSAELCRLLGGINRSTLARGVQVLEERVVSRGSSRRSRYALRRELRGSLAALPLYRIDETGQGHEVGQLDLLYPAGSALALREPFLWPLDDNSRDGWFDGLPYPLMDMRPQGFLGRNFAHQHGPDLAVSDNPEAWSESDIAHVLSTMGSDLPGNLILGERAYRRFLDSKLLARGSALLAGQLELAYPDLAAAALAQGAGGSSAGGEFPKFTARRYMGERLVEVIVKFSGADGSLAVQRWADLLVCEHLALETVNQQLGIQAAQSAIRHYAGRTFLEVLRFDRHDNFGRSPVCTLSSINASLLGTAAQPWPRTAQLLHKKGWLSAESVAAIERIWWFGRLIGNTDMHEGNLAFRPGLTLAPTYDMLPMLYAPLRGGELPTRAYAPELPLPAETPAWRQAAEAARYYWRLCLADPRISPAFQQICAENAQTLDQVRANSF